MHNYHHVGPLKAYIHGWLTNDTLMASRTSDTLKYPVINDKAQFPSPKLSTFIHAGNEGILSP